MATYDLDRHQLVSGLAQYVSPSTENAIIAALKQAGDFPSGHHKIAVDVENTSGAFAVPQHDKLFLDLGAFNQITVKTHGGTVISGGDGGTTITDVGRGGDTLIGGAGSETLKVTQGRNLLEAGTGRNTLIGGSGHDTLRGGGRSLLEAGSGHTTLIGGLASPSGDHRGHHHGGGGGGPADTLVGGSGQDVMLVLHGSNVLYAGSGHDTLTGGDGSDSMYGGSGKDTMNLTGGNTWVQGGTGADTVNIGLHGNASIYGGASTTVDTEQASFEVTHDVTHRGVTTLTFSDHQQLTVQNVTINFSDGVTDKV